MVAYDSTYGATPAASKRASAVSKLSDLLGRKTLIMTRELPSSVVIAGAGIGTAFPHVAAAALTSASDAADGAKAPAGIDYTELDRALDA